MISSCIYNGNVIHKRFKPKEHFFKYKVFSLFIDLSELNELNNKLKFFSLNKFNLISFYEKDHGDRDGSSLFEWVKKNLINYEISTDNIKVKLLCYPRIFGYVFNPLSIFFVYDNNDNLIKNTCKKKFHVSPFIEMNCTYFFKILKPNNKISLIIDQYDDEGKLLYASQDGNRIDLNNKNLILSYLRHPLMTFKIIAAIHFEAFKLWIKGIKFVKKKLNIKNNISIEN